MKELRNTNLMRLVKKNQNTDDADVMDDHRFF